MKQTTKAIRRVLAGLAVFLLSSTLALAQPRGGRHGGPGWGAGPEGLGGPGPLGGGMLRGMMGAALDLDDAQKEQIRSILEATRTSLQPVMEQLRQNREAAQAAVQAGKSDAELQQIADEGGRLHAQIQGAMLKAHAKVWAVLTPQQKEKWNKLREEARARMEERMRQRMNQP